MCDMIIQNINNLIIELDEKAIQQQALATAKRVAGTATQLAVSGMVTAAMPGYTILAPILGSIVGGAISSIVTGLISSIENYKQIIAKYKKQLQNVETPEQKAKLQNKINEINNKLNQKRVILSREKNDLAKRTNEMRAQISKMEREKNNLTPTELVKLEKYKKIVANRLKVMPRLSV